MTKERFNKLSSDNITKKEYDQILAEIDGESDDIWRFITTESGATLDWWIFGNDIEGKGDFDPFSYNKFISIIGENTISYQNPYYEGFPTELLWDENWRETVKNEIEKSKKEINEKKLKIKLNRENKKGYRAELKKIIQSKLTKEELKVITFKK